MFKFTLKFLAWGFGVIFGLLAVVCLVVWVVNWRDQPPSEVVKNFESALQNRVSIPDTDNAYVYIMGFAVAKDQNPLVLGAKRIALIDGVANGQEADLDNDPLMKDEDFKHDRSEAIKAIADTCNRVINQKCLDALEGGDEAITAWMNSEELLYRRYLELLEYSQYQEVLLTDVNLPLPNFGALMDGQKLFLAHTYLLARQGDAQKVKMLLDKDIAYWRMTLASTDMLISKMIAVAALKRDFLIGNFILKKLTETTGSSVIPEAWHKPLSPLELSILSSIRGEWFWADKLIKNLGHGIKYEPTKGYVKGYSQTSEFLMSLALQPQDYSNKHAQQLSKLVGFFDVPFTDYPKAIVNAQSQVEASQKREYHIYNFTGNILLGIALPAYSNYAVRVADLEGVRQAAVLTSDIRNQSLSAEAIPDYITRSTYRNPYTQKPFEWDSEAKAIKFTGLEEGERGTYLLTY